jgi:ketosteroid isomerase-like protein
MDAGFDQLAVELEEVRDMGDTVVGLGRLFGRSKQGVPIDMPYGVVARFSDGLVVSGRDWMSHTDPLEAVGLSE